MLGTFVLQAMMPGESGSWHRGGLFMGMHWIWWLFWIVMIAVLLWAFWRLFAERGEVSREAERKDAAEEALRRRFAEGEIDADELARGLEVLRESRLAG